MSKNKKGLGRGFDSLFPSDLFDESFDPTSQQDKKSSKLESIPLDKIIIDKDQPRKNFDEKKLAVLAESIKRHGVLQPIVVIKKSDKFQIVAGERRFRASQLAGKKDIPAVIRTLSSQNRLEVALIENIQRQDLNVVEIATAYLKLREQFNMTLAQIGKTVGGRSIGSVSNIIRLLRLPTFVLEAIREDKITEGQARPLIGLDEEIIKQLLPKIIKNSWSARQIEHTIANYKKGIETADTQKAIDKVLLVKERAEGLSKKFNTKINIRATKNGSGTIQIKFKNHEEYKRLIKQLED